MSKSTLVDMNQFAIRSNQQGCAEFMNEVEGVIEGLK